MHFNFNFYVTEKIVAEKIQRCFFFLKDGSLKKNLKFFTQDQPCTTKHSINVSLFVSYQIDKKKKKKKGNYKFNLSRQCVKLT